ncbi:PaaI family thioesterase [Variovorax sp. YR216]|uniref:PaaI family thioesterase n=1 Tax=Variovorax sp. YR216 TaxID=1882828 RepID=UPI0008942E87|nr:PaaI family thioesterase [Variovorax sp. YR216]SEB25294.1 acyl-CoA thioesterase [Variovorax sp. YR216]
MHHPFAEHIDLAVEEQRAGFSKLSLVVGTRHLNPHGVVHGAIAYAMADTGMGAALYPTLSTEQICATIEVKINYFKPIVSGRLVCVTELVNRGKAVANLTSKIYVDDKLVALANGNYAIFTPGKSGV